MTGNEGRNLDLANALSEAEGRYIAANPASAARYEDACRSMPGGNTRSVIFYPPFPLTLAGGEGATVRDLDGHSYIDLLGEYTAGLHGHSNPKIQAAVTKALEGGLVLGGPNAYEADLAALVCARFPSVELVRFCNSGTEANMMALSAARAHSGRAKVMAFRGAYHGGLLYFAGHGSPLNAPFPYLMADYNDADSAADLIAEHAADLAAVIVEPMLGAGGTIPGTAAFLQRLRAETERHGVLLVLDEVMTSRLAPGGLQAVHGITPDLTSFGKYLGGGLTFGAFGGRAEIMGRFDPRRADAFPHAGTFNNNTLTMAAGVAGLREVFTEAACRDLNDRGDALRQRLNRIAADAGVAAQVTGIGSIMGVHFQRQPIAGPDDLGHTPDAARALFHIEMLNRGYYLARRGFVALSLALSAADIDGFADAFADYLKDYGGLLHGEG